jgi:hypothetical protein
MTPVLKLVGGPCDGAVYGGTRHDTGGRNPQPWPVVGPGCTPLYEIGTGVDLTGYTPARHNGRHWVSEWLYVHRGGRRRWCCEGCDQPTCPNWSFPAGGAQ